MAATHDVNEKARRRPVRAPLALKAWMLLAAAILLAACESTTPDDAAQPNGAAGSGSGDSGGPVVMPSAPARLGGGTGNVTGPGVTPTQITLGQIATQTGPDPGAFQSSIDSIDAFAAYINSQGGINGRKLAIVRKDDAFDCTTYTNLLKTLNTQVFAMVGTWSNQDGCGKTVLREHPDLPNLHGGMLDLELYKLPNVFAGLTLPPGQATNGYEWVKKKYPDGVKKAGFLYSTYAPTIAKAVRKTGEAVGYKYVYARGLGATETSFSSDILRMKAAGVSIVDLSGTNTDLTANFVREAAQQGYQPDAIISPSAYSPKFFELVGDPKAAANVVAPLPYAMFLGEDRTANPALEVYLTWLNKVRPGAKPDMFGMASWSSAMLFAQAMKAAGPNVNRAALLKAITNLGPSTANGMNPPSDPGKHKGATCVVIVGVRDGKYVRLDPAGGGFQCAGIYHNV